MTNSFNKQASDRPAAYVDSADSLGFGVDISGIYPFGGHGVFSSFRYLYLTTLEASRNFGYDYKLELGYAYISEAFTGGVVLGNRVHRINNTTASDEDPNLTYRVIGSINEQIIGIFAQF